MVIETPTYAQMSGVVASLGNRRSRGDVALNTARMRDLGAPRGVLALLGEVMDDRALLTAIANRSYRHVNHFDKIVLVEAQSPNGYRLTLHLWIPPFAVRETAEELIHDHRFSFWSAILTGTLRSQEFSLDPDGVAYNAYRYSPDIGSAHNLYAYQGVRRLKRHDRVLEKASEVYYLAHDVTHRVILPEDGITCTLVLRGPRARGYSNIYNATYPSTDTSNVNRMFSADELFDRLDRLRRAIAGQQVASPGVPALVEA